MKRFILATMAVTTTLLFLTPSVLAGGPPPAADCPCDYLAIPHTEFNKYGIKTVRCNLIIATNREVIQLRGISGQGTRFNLAASEDLINSGGADNFCYIILLKGKLR